MPKKKPVPPPSNLLMHQDFTTLPADYKAKEPDNSGTPDDRPLSPYQSVVTELINSTDELAEFVERYADFLVSLRKGNVLDHPKYVEYLMKLRGVVDVSNKFASFLDVVESGLQDDFSEANRSCIIDILNEYKSFFEGRNDPKIPVHIGTFDRYIAFIDRVFETKGYINESEEVNNKLAAELDTSINAFARQSVAADRPQNCQKQAALEAKTAKVYNHIHIKCSLRENLHSTLLNLENFLLNARLLLSAQPRMDAVEVYLEINRNMINVQIRLLGHFSKTQDPVMQRWAVYNVDLNRTYMMEKKMPASILLTGKNKELLSYREASIVEIRPLIDFTVKSNLIIKQLLSKQGNVDEHLASISELVETEPCNRNPLMRFIALSTAITCHNTKIDVTANLNEVQVASLQEAIEKEAYYLRRFTENLAAVEPMWNQELFKFFNNFVSIKKDIQFIISIAELIFLQCETLFKRANKDNLKFKRHIVDVQIELLGMQNTILKFIKKNCSEDYVTEFYIKEQKGIGFVYYNTKEINKKFAQRGDNRTVVNGLILNDILDRNIQRKLELEAIVLEFLAGQREPKDSDYLHANALGNDDIEKYLTQWEQESAQQRALEDKKTPPLSKQQKLKKLGEKKREKDRVSAAAKEEGKKANPAQIEVVTTTSSKVTEPLALKMDELLLTLNPGKFNAADVKRVINELHDLTLTSTNDELIFKALCAIGDSYGMIAGHFLNHKKKDPEVMIVCLKLSLNLYSRAELKLRKLDNIPFENHSMYYTWLMDSVSIQKQLLDKYVQKFAAQLAQSESVRKSKKAEQGQQWYENHAKEGWKESHNSINRKALDQAMKAAEGLQQNFDEFSTHIQRGRPQLDFDCAPSYSFQHQLKHAKKITLPEGGVSHALDDDLELPSNDGVLVRVPSEANPEGITDVVLADQQPLDPRYVPVPVPRLIYMGGMAYAVSVFATEYPVPPGYIPPLTTTRQIEYQSYAASGSDSPACRPQLLIGCELPPEVIDRAQRRYAESALGRAA